MDSHNMEFALFGALISALGFGLANIVIKKSLSTASIPQVLLNSMVSGSVFLFILVLINGFPRDTSFNLFFTLALFAIGETCLYLSLYKAFEKADVTVAAGVISIYPIFSTIFTVLFFNEKITLLKVFFTLLMVIGVILISIDWTSIKTSKFGYNSFTKGLPWAILCLLIHSLYFPALGNLTSSGDWQFKLLGIKIFAIIFIFLIFVVFKKTKFEFTRNRLIAGALLGFLEIMGWVGLSFASSNTTGMIAIIIALGSSAPLITAIVAKYYLKENLHKMQYFGIVTVIVGLYLIAVV